MSELTDDQLDGLFRKSAEEFDPPFDPAAWQDMKALLDANDRPAPGGGTPVWKTILRWGLVFCLFLLLLVGSFLSYTNLTKTHTEFLVTGNHTQTKTTATGQTAAKSPLRSAASPKNAFTDVSPQSIESGGGGQPAVSETSANEPAGPDEVHLKAGEKAVREQRAEPVGRDATNPEKAAYAVKADGAATPTAPSRTATITKTVAPAVSMSKRSVKTRKTKGFLMDRQFTTRRPESTVQGNRYPMMRLGALTGKKVSAQKAAFVSGATAGIAYTNQPKVVQGEAAGLSAIHELAIRPAHWPGALPFRGRDWAVASQPDTATQRVKPAIPVQRGLSIRFAVAPDLSSVGLKNFSRPGTNIGVLLEYRLASRWSVQAGLLQSTKLYRASGTEYTTPTGWWQSPMKLPTWVDGRCNMFDIPINIRYDVLVRPQQDNRQPTRWFVSGGVTSYIMKEEEYYYTYPAHTYNQPNEYTAKSGGYGFSNLNLSVGYERAITKRLSWQVEPFMKVPLKRVGFFKIDLLSTGTFFSIRYKL